MGKKKPAIRRGGSDSALSPRTKTGGQDEPVTDTVMQVITRRVRNARKKLQRVAVIENLLHDGQMLNEDQERVYMTKVPLNAIIEELQKLEPLVEAALGNELAEHVNAAKEDWKKKREQETTDVLPVVSDEGESEATVEGPSRAKERNETTEDDLEETTKEETASTDAPAIPAGTDNAMEALYFLQLFAGDRFDLSPFFGEDAESMGVISSEEAEFMESFAKKIFQTTSHNSTEALEMTKEAGKRLFPPSHPEATKIFEIVAKLKDSEVMDQEIKLSVRGFPLAIEKEVSDTTTEHTDKSEEKLKQESPPHLTSTVPDQPPPSYLDENPPSSSPAHPSTSYHFTHPQDSAPMGQKSPRPFLPFPGVGMGAAPPLRFGVTPPPNVMGVHSYYSMAPIPGHFVSPPPFQAMPPQAHAPHSPHPPPVIEQEPQEEPNNLPETMPERATEPEMPGEEDTVEELPKQSDLDVAREPISSAAGPPPVADQSLSDFAPDMVPEVVGGSGGGGYAPKPRGRGGPQRQPPPSGGRYPYTQGDYRPVWQGRGGRHPFQGNRGGMRGRGPRGGRHSYPYGGRPPYDQQQPPPRAPFMAPAGGERHPFDMRGRQRRGGFDRSKDAGSR